LKAVCNIKLATFQVDTKGPPNGSVAYTPNGYDTERYGTMPTNYNNGHVYGDPSMDDIGPLNR